MSEEWIADYQEGLRRFMEWYRRACYAILGVYSVRAMMGKKKRDRDGDDEEDKTGGGHYQTARKSRGGKAIRG